MADENLNVFQQKAREWALKVVALNNTPVPVEFESKKRALINTAKKIKITVEKIAGASTALSPMNQLGVIPVIIGVGVIAAALAGITKWTLDYSKFNSELAYQKELVKTGLSPQQAASIINNQSGAFGTLAKYAIPALLIGGAVWFFTRKKGAK